MSGLGWLTESALIPTKSKDIKVDQSSLMDLKVQLLQKKNNLQHNSTQKNVKKAKKYEDVVKDKGKINKGIEIRNKKDIQQ